MIRTIVTHIRYRWIAAVVALLVGVLLAVHALLPYIVNTRDVRQRVISRIASSFPGEVTFSRVIPALLPRPHALVTDFHLSEGERIVLEVPRMAIYPDARSLATGQLKIGHIKLFEPRAILDTAHFKTGPSDRGGAQADEPVLSSSLRPIAAIIGAWGDMAVEVLDGRIEVRRSGRAAATVYPFTSRIQSAGQMLRLNMHGETDLSGGFTLAGKMNLAAGYGRWRFTASGLDSGILGVAGLDENARHLLKTAVDLDLEVDLFGFERLHARFSARAPGVDIGEGDRRLSIDHLAMSGRATWTPQGAQIALHRFRTTSPPMNWAGSLSWSPVSSRQTLPIRISLKGVDLQIAPLRKALLHLFHDHPVAQTALDVVRDGRMSSVTAALSAPGWTSLAEMARLRVEGHLTDGHIVVPGQRFDLKQVQGRVAIENGRLDAYGLEARQGNTVVRHGALTMGLFDGSRDFYLDTLVDADAAELPVLLRKVMHPKKAALNLERLPPISGRVSGRLTLGDRLDSMSASVTAKARLRTDASALDLVGRMDQRAGGGASAGIFVKGRMGQEALNWLGTLGDAPPLLPAAPFTITGADILWDSSGKGRASGVAAWDDGLLAEAAVSFSDRDVVLHRLHIRDAVSDALISVGRRQQGRLLDARFAGYLEKATLDRLLESHRLKSGGVQGHVQLHLDRDDPSRTLVNGVLDARDIAYPLEKWGTVRVIEGAVNGYGRQISVPGALVKWDGSTFTLKGGGTVSQKAIDIHATVMADRLNTETLLAALKPAQTGVKDSPDGATTGSSPLRGKISVEVGQLVHDRYRFAPLLATIDIGAHQTVFDISDADLCGIQMPGQIVFSKGTARMDFTPRARRSDIQDVGACLGDRRNSERLAGTIDLDGRMTTQGRTRDAFLKNLKGDIGFTIDNGRISNVGSAGFFTNLLSYLSVNQYIKGDLPDLRKDEFSYNRIESKWVFDDGRVQIREGMLKSNSVNMVADGHYQLLSREMDMVVLVSPLTTVDWIVERIPVLGNILQGTLVAIPVRVKGPHTNPAVLPLSPKAVGARLGGILKRTVRTPVRIIEPLLKEKPAQGSP